MPNYDEDGNLIEDDDTGNGDGDGPKGLRAAKRAAEQRARELESQLADARKDQIKLATLETGLDTSNKTVQKFLEHYDGPVSGDALKAAAVEWGILSDTTPDAGQSIDGQQQIASAMGGGGQGTIPPSTTSTGLVVPGEQAPMWEEFERAVSGPGGSAQAGQAVLEKYGINRDGMIEQRNIIPR